MINGEKTTCPACHRQMSSPASLTFHRKYYYRYREGKKVRRPVFARQGGFAEIDDAAVEFGMTAMRAGLC